MQVAIIGCGPAGLLAAHAAEGAGHETYIFSPKKESHISGAQFLHINIPDLTTDEADGIVEFRKWGEPSGYALKIYGDPDHLTSWGAYPRSVYDIWNMQSAYRKLWSKYHDQIVDRELIYSDLKMLSGEFPVVINTAPLRALCAKPREHKFTSQPVWISNESPDIPKETNRIIYNGRPETGWYRQSRIFSHGSTEWPHEVQHLGVLKIHKPLGNNCDCHPKVWRAGRYGRWEKGVLIHHAYETAMAIFDGMATRL